MTAKPTEPLSDEPIRVMQSIPGGEDANCMEACIATLLAVPIFSVPSLRDAEWVQQLRAWLKPMGWGFVSIGVPDEALFLSEFGFGYQIAAGLSKRGRLHAVIYKDGKLWHDPHPDSTGLVSIEQVDYLYPLNAALLALHAGVHDAPVPAVVERNAARYEHLRRYQWDLIILPQFVGHPRGDGDEYAATPEELDAAIDAAIAKEKP